MAPRGRALSTALLVPRVLWVNVAPQTCGLARGWSLYMKWKKVHHLQVNISCLGNGERAGFQLPIASWARHPCAPSNLPNCTWRSQIPLSVPG